MKAIVKKEPTVGLWMDEVEEPRIQNHEVLIKVRKASICGTDINIYNWSPWAQKNVPLGLTIGHEFMGNIVEVGAGVKGYKVGERVIAENHVACGICRSCRTGNIHICKNTRGLGYHKNGGFAEYVAVPAVNLFPVPAGIDDATAAIFDPLGNATHTALNAELVGEDVLITGAGPIGIMAGAIARFAGARHVVITDVKDFRLDLANQLGIDHTVNILNEDPRDVMQRLGIDGFSVGMEMSGNAAALNSLLELMYPGGRVALLGILPPQTGIDWDQVMFKGLNLQGIYGRKMFETWYKMSNMLEAGLDIGPIITGHYSLSEFQLAFDTMKSGNCGKVILHLDD